MMVPEPKPMDPWAMTRMRTTVSHGLGFLNPGSAAVSSSRSGPGFVVGLFLRFECAPLVGIVGSSGCVIVASPVAWARELAGGWALARASQIKAGKLGGRLAS